MTPYTLNRTAGPSAEPVTLAEARDHCEIISTDTVHDTKLGRFIGAARELVERETELVLMTQTYTVSVNAFQPYFHVPVRPIQSVSSITYYDADDTQQTVTSTIYGLDATRQQVYLEYNQTWPTYTSRRNGIVITLVCGFGAADNIPNVLKQAILLKVGEWFDLDRGDARLMPTHGQGYRRLIDGFMRTSYP